MKKLLSLILVLAMMLTSLSFAMADEVPEYDGSPVTIKFYHTMGSNLTAVLDQYIPVFNEIYPNITIEYTSVGGYDDVRDQISKEITVGNQPHIAYCYPDHVALYNLARAVQPLDAYIDHPTMGLTEEQKADFIEGYYNEGKQFGDGKMYTLPMSKSTEVLYYNKTFFDANNIAVPTTWDELEATFEQIVAVDPLSIPLGYDSEANWFITMCEQMKTPYTSATKPNFLFDDPANHAFVKRFASWFQNGYATTQSIFGSYTSGLFVSTDEIKSYMSIGSSAGATHQRPAKDADGTYPFEVGITTVPQYDAENKKVISQGPSLCIFKKANPQEVAASWLFVKFLTTSVEFQAEFSMASGYVPVIKSVAQNEVYAEFINGADGGDNIAALSAKVCLEQQDAYYTSPAFPGSSEARDQVGNIIATAMTECATQDFTSAKVDEIIAKIFADALTKCNDSIKGFGN